MKVRITREQLAKALGTIWHDIFFIPIGTSKYHGGRILDFDEYCYGLGNMETITIEIDPSQISNKDCPHSSGFINAHGGIACKLCGRLISNQEIVEKLNDKSPSLNDPMPEDACDICPSCNHHWRLV